MTIVPLQFPNINTPSPLIISGPCSAETEEQTLSTARELSALGIKIFRAGIWKPRTKPGGFEGVGNIGLKWLQKIHKETEMLTAVEVATRKHVIDALDHNIDILWLGARTTVNPFSVQEIASTISELKFKGTVFVKNPVNPDLELWIGAIERIYNAGITNIAAIHRGFSTYETTGYRNSPHWHIPIELKRRYPTLSIIGDPSHIGGNRELILPLSQQMIDLNYNGLIIESHINPEDALSDKFQQITPTTLKTILQQLIIRDKNLVTEQLNLLREQIDMIDDEFIYLLSKRMNIVREIGKYKKENNMPILQTSRYNEIQSTRQCKAEKLSLDNNFIKEILSIIHQEAIKQQF
ncbi:cytochrome c4 [Bacteroidia bacterium]|nr:cytochrome c4 [Bacteroidia bacterium]